MRPIHLLALLPAAGVLIGPFFLNRVTPPDSRYALSAGLAVPQSRTHVSCDGDHLSQR
ncbi:hypothetical protein CBM2633_P190010 [Cupriavidus taiwanensis]|uniref:Uncharacterized protein n=2 Tax=Cupriavidus TaxID=106589 RepID=A0A375GQH9_9BURK|nr:hypothetical protein CBM2585_P190008 [Cupriavidus taiwanensis]SOZ40464.1 hypothetical protein CBM2605_P190008 [Cupriavidus neocaledonicus]SOY74624.1 hypothetical protein CBM2588_P210009 [Cupriavidus taiwanensis]SOY74630.1 hypothetical protein CBM2592_P220009 [Cupriavidus taiwanensis]SOY75541.1 hypothetical protein CBM2589_P190009 [Cupriavidus taiwanensis]